MELEIRQQNSVLRLVSARIPAERVRARLEEAYRQLRQRAHIKGFRPGRAPLELIRRLYGEVVQAEVFEELANEVASALWDQGHRPFGSVRVRAMQLQEDGSLQIEAEFDVKPEFTLADFEGLEVRVPVHTVRSEDVERELEQLRAHRAVLVPKEGPAEEGDYVLLEVQELDPSGLPILGTRQERWEQLDKSRISSGFYEALVGAAVGSERVLEEHAESGLSRRVLVRLKELKAVHIPDWDEALVQELSRGRFADLEELRQDVRAYLERQWERFDRSVERELIRSKLLELHPIPIPPSLVEHILERMLQDRRRRQPNVDPERFRSENRPLAERAAHWQLVREKLIEHYGIAVQEEDFDRYFADLAQRSRLPEEQLRRYYQGLWDDLEAQLLEDKVIALLKSKLKIVPELVEMPTSSS
ncbi:MAG: trigger factor [Bacteroidetes bacterium]|nr:trigger factor [Rhodothermia bacterium]MCS7154310.1 trigger factor [Bacteroidota bacterium]MCX7906654.1 trigger factor [Bacteroidota bacterium]MDW8137066.1 trigger factor [Bacteroidota bacterium]MDW8285063.1 trigger factor [Bacteroidota bacterium]